MQPSHIIQFGIPAKKAVSTVLQFVSSNEK